MIQLRTHALERAIAVVLVHAAMLLGVGQGPARATHTSDVTAAAGLAYNYYTDVSLFGGPSTLRGYGQVVCDANGQPSACVPAASADASASPSVNCPADGGTATLTDQDGAKAQYGPAVIFGGKWPEEATSAPPSGPLTSTVECVLGENGRVTASTDVILMPIGSAYPGGAGPGPFVADEVHGTCTATAQGHTASTTIVNGILETRYDPSTQLPVESEPVPTNPPVNYTRQGTIDHVGDSYEIIFNEQIVNPDGSITVNAAHLYLLGPTAVGYMVIGSSTCGPLASTLIPDPEADLSVSIAESADPAATHGELTYTITVTSAGPTGAREVTLLSDVQGIRVTSATTDGGTCTVLKGKMKGVSCQLGDVALGTGKSVEITGKAPAKEGTASITSTVSSSNDPNSSNDSATETTSIRRL